MLYGLWWDRRDPAHRVEVNAYEDTLDEEYDEDFEDQSAETPVNSVQEEPVLARNRNAP